jgi:hypothetical protein
VLVQAIDVRGGARLHFEPVRRGVLSWNTPARSGTLRFRLLRAGEPASAWYDYVHWTGTGRKSFSPQSDSDGIAVDVDVISARTPFDGIDVLGDDIDFSFVAWSSPQRAAPSRPAARDASILDVPARTQYVVEGERGWCSPASLSMVNAFHGFDRSVEDTARAVMDQAYNGTGNWAFNTAYSGSLGLRACVAYIRNLDQARVLIERNIPLVISYSWSAGELPGAPLPHSDGHLVVLRGFTSSGDCAVNDPAAPEVSVVYSRSAIEHIWQRNDGVAYVIAPAGTEFAGILNS